MKAPAAVALLGALSLVSIAAADLPETVTCHSAKADVVFQHPNSFKDIKDSYNPTDKGELGLLTIFGQDIVDRADSMLPAGYHLTMTFTEVDFAGDFEPFRGPQSDDIRIIRDIYPPHYTFTWTLTHAAGQVVKQGSENLSDIDFQMNYTLDHDTPIAADKAEIENWMRTHLGPFRK